VIEACDPNWKEGLPPELVIVYGDPRKKYLECYTIEAIEEVDRKIDALPRGSVGRKTLERIFHGNSFPTSVDETGRLVLPAKLRQKIDVTDAAYFIASGDTFQIWNPDTLRPINPRPMIGSTQCQKTLIPLPFLMVTEGLNDGRCDNDA
jgi:MraZ protein